jgi:hypothetical protein
MTIFHRSCYRLVRVCVLLCYCFRSRGGMEILGKGRGGVNMK